MAGILSFGPTPPDQAGELSVSSSPQSPSYTTASSESPKTTSTFSFNVILTNPRAESSDDDVVPKIEEVEDDEMEDMKATLPLMEDGVQIPERALVKRPRGRPRKHPKTPPTSIAKAPKGRSKTGCITCRRRKKKCDETKPACMHCQKNNVHCEGYPPKSYWESGRQRAVKVRRSSVDQPLSLPILIEGIENDVDWFFFNHFNMNVSRVLVLFTDRQNPFKEILLPMATSHKGLMHSLLCLAGSHLTAREPNKSFEERQYHHFQCAVENLQSDSNMAANIAGDSTAIIDDPTVAQTLVLCLKSICAGEVNGEYRPHMDAAKHLITTQQSPNQDFQTFLFEFFVYHDVSNSVTSLDRKSVLMMEDFKLPEFMIQPEAGAFLGVVDGLFGCISKIRHLRDRIRYRRTNGLKPMVDYDILSDAQAIDGSLRAWESGQPIDTPRYTAAMLYRQCTWLYLHRTILPSAPNIHLKVAVDEGLNFLRDLPPDASTQSILLMPLFLLGCAAFEEYQRPDIIAAFDSLQSYSSLGNIRYAKTIVELVWELMDAGDDSSWDWETIIYNKGWDFLIT